MIKCSNIWKEDAHIQKDIENKLIFLNAWHYFNIILLNLTTFHLAFKRAQAFLSFILLHYQAYIWAPVCIWAWL